MNIMKNKINKIVYATAFVMFCMTGIANAGGWVPITNQVFALTLQPTGTVYQLTARDLNWRKSLVKNLKVESWLQEKGHVMATFLQTNHKCVLNSNEQLSVYAKSDDKNILVVKKSLGTGFGTFVVDLNKQAVYSQCGWSSHFGPSDNFMVALGTGYQIQGVQVGDTQKDPSTGKWIFGAKDPIFTKNVITWW